jgi:hypothetical protein
LIPGAWLGVLFALALGATPAHSDTANEVYVWQRQWTPALHAALRDSRDLFGGVRVLVAQAGRDNRWLETRADPSAFTSDPRALVAVIRYDGAGAPPDSVTLRHHLDGLLARWRAQGAAFVGVEIDYDCASARLADYAAALRELRAALPVDVRLSITALPAWLDSADLDAVLAASDESVLQVHSVRRPAYGLFDGVLAERWARAFAARTRKPFRVALPAYGSRIRFDDGGRIFAVENEMQVDAAAGDDAREFAADPRAIVELLAHLRAAPPTHWQGVVWFRLPLPGDRRAWTLAALREVISGQVPRTRVEVEMLARENGATDIVVVNRGGVVAPAVAFRLVDASCSAHDAANGWNIRSRAGALRFEPASSLRIAPGRRRAAGWVRCADPPKVIDEQVIDDNGIDNNGVDNIRDAGGQQR